MIARLLQMAALDWMLPNFSALCRRQKSLSVQIPCRRVYGPLSLLVDRTGITFPGDGKWRVRKHDTNRRRQWRKVHLAMDPTASDIRAVELKLRTNARWNRESCGIVASALSSGLKVFEVWRAVAPSCRSDDGYRRFFPRRIPRDI